MARGIKEPSGPVRLHRGFPWQIQGLERPRHSQPRGRLLLPQRRPSARRTDARKQTTTAAYDAGGNKTSVTNPLSQTTTYTFDGQGRVLTVRAPNGGVTTYNYDVAGNLLSLTDPDNNTTSYSYNAVNQNWTLAKIRLKSSCMSLCIGPSSAWSVPNQPNGWLLFTLRT